jgi:hypothetical protein
MPKAPKGRVDLSLLKRLVEELDKMVIATEAMAEAKGDKNEWVLEMSKATGVAAGIMTEAGLLMGDLQSLMQGPSTGASKQDLLDKLLGGLKGPGNAN